MQHELFCSIVPPEQLFVPVHPTPLLSGSHPLLFYEATATHTHTVTQCTCGPLLSSAGVVDLGIKRRGVPLRLNPESHSG